jgi:DNA-3-methyladenine glycosylase
VAARSRRAAPLPVSFFARDVVTVARELLGCDLISTLGRVRTVARIVEVEAYLGGEDPASHAFELRRTARNQAIYGPAGSWYVYLSYGVHWCANLVAGERGVGAAILIRAAEPLEGLAAMERRRRSRVPKALCSGPGRLCQSLGITRRRLDGKGMRNAGVVVVPGVAPASVRAGPRVGITKAADWPLRYVAEGSRWLSRG